MPKIHATNEGGVLFECPGCEMIHVVYVTTPDRPRWTFNGDFDRPTFLPSVHVSWEHGEEKHVCHSFINNGLIQYLDDCTHSLKGQTVEIPEWER